MTCIMIWRNREPNQDEIWAVADTRVSQDNTGARPLTDEAPKLFSLTVRCYKPPETGGSFSEKCYEGSIGLAFAGSTLLAHSTVLAVSPLLANLATFGALPSLSDIASFVAMFLKRYTFGVNLNMSISKPTLSEMAVFGRSPVDNSLQIFTIKPVLKASPIKLDITEFDSSELDTVLYLGDHKSSMCEQVKSEREKLIAGSLPWWRAPHEVLKRVVQDSVYPSIGGSEQLGITRSREFELHLPVFPVKKGEKYSAMKYLGIQLPPDGLVGQCFIGIRGMY